MSGLTRKVRIKKSRLISNGPNAQSWVGLEIEEEFPVEKAPEKTQELLDEVDILIKEQEQKEREIQEEKMLQMHRY
ncbi:MAG: hypothetical protein ACLFQV_08775 [Vulcanimicrobiota bacterium]